jgi:hypothetical protein
MHFLQYRPTFCLLMEMGQPQFKKTAILVSYAMHFLRATWDHLPLNHTLLANGSLLFPFF